MKAALTMPVVLAGGGVVASTLVSLAAARSGWLVMAGPVLMALALLAAGATGPRDAEARPRAIRLALISGASVVVAAAIVAFADPRAVALIMPILGAGATSPVLSSVRGGRAGGEKCTRDI